MHVPFRLSFRLPNAGRLEGRENLALLLPDTEPGPGPIAPSSAGRSQAPQHSPAALQLPAWGPGAFWGCHSCPRPWQLRSSPDPATGCSLPKLRAGKRLPSPSGTANPQSKVPQLQPRAPRAPQGTEPQEPAVSRARSHGSCQGAAAAGAAQPRPPLAAAATLLQLPTRRSPALGARKGAA